MGYAGKINIGEDTHLIGSALYGICNTGASTAEKVVTLSDFDTLIEGITIKVKFIYSNTAADPTLNVNGTGDLPIYRHGVVPPGNSTYNTWAANAVLSFTYDGTAWRMEEPFDLTQIMGSVFNAIYPVGSIYISTNSASPSTLFGGTWTQIKDRFLLSAGDTYTAGGTGGEAEHTLSTTELPSHAHTGGAHTHAGGSHTHGLNGHTHTIPALSGSAASNGSHSHAMGSGSNAYYVAGTQQMLQGVAGQASNLSGFLSQMYAIFSSTQSAGAHTHTVSTNASTTGGNSGNTAGASSYNTGAVNGTYSSGNTGGGGAHNNMPPYLAVYVWKRVA